MSNLLPDDDLGENILIAGRSLMKTGQKETTGGFKPSAKINL